MENGKRPIKSFRDLQVYQNLYKAMIIVLTKIVPKLPGGKMGSTLFFLIKSPKNKWNFIFFQKATDGN
jgi:hypothetical protein